MMKTAIMITIMSTRTSPFKSPKKTKAPWIALAVVALVFVMAALTLTVLYSQNTKAVQATSEEVYFDVVEGDSMASVLARLEDEKLIKSAFFAKYKAKFMKQESVFVGTFLLDPSWDTEEILDYLSHASFGVRETTVFLVEGSWAKDMAKTISESVALKEQDLLDLWNNEVYIKSLMEKYEVLPKDLLDNKDARVLLEGYLYPDTYDFYVRTTAEELTERLVSNANDKYLSYKDRIPASMTPYEFTTLASIVEYEASSDTDMRMVAGVFLNRLEQGIKLESSVTICYALYDFDTWEDCEKAKNNQVESPYNTYRYLGLPPGPILNPSLRALEATLDATKSDYIFFIADVHNVVDGKVHYQATYEEHEKVRLLLLGY